MNTALKALPALLVALVGAGLAYLFLEVGKLIPLLIAVPVFAVGFLASRRGRSLLDDLKPKESIVPLELGALQPAILAALVVGVGISLGVELEPDKNASVETQKLLAAILAALAAFLSAAVVAAADDADGIWLAPKIESLFQEKLRVAVLERTGSTDEDGIGALNNDLWGNDGWGFRGRRERAKAIAAKLTGPIVPEHERQGAEKAGDSANEDAAVQQDDARD